MEALKRLLENQKLKSNEIEFVRVEMEDIHGISRGLTLDIDHFIRCIDTGVPLCKSTNAWTVHGQYVPKTGLQEEIDYENGFLYPNLETFRVLPWKKNTASVLGDLRLEYDNMESSFMQSHSRAICKKQIGRLREKNWQIFGAYEFEFYILNKVDKSPVFKEVNMFSTFDTSRHDFLLQNISRNMKQMEIMPELYHVEYGPSQYELTMRPSFGITLCDNAFRFRHLAKEIAASQNQLVTFMSKPFSSSSGSSGHFNHSLWDLDGNNLFYDKENKNHLSELGQQWLAGLIFHSKTLMCLACPTPNCYDRRNSGVFAATTDLWGFDNRSVTYRVKMMNENGTYIENRKPGAAVNPYLLTAASIIAGMDGIKKGMTLTMPPYKGDVAISVNLPAAMKTLPKSLEESLKHLKENDLFVRELGDEFMKCFTAIKSAEEEETSKIKECEREQWYLDNYTRYL
ncbi:glutamate--isopropylamine ligase-like [Hydractinia symbiolongicarpus]|uniref:glutamate--isopropylamine ligase-like n=1 Tax=Hydractinia symbiolongicarpus TaxID=13093 RepID=UPI00254C0A71|nr:glutamate--isopropylamine ligase-like [Hydractinia symbiolongicarpus]